MSHADAFVLCSHYEGFGMVLLEAMACGVPVVATDCESGPREAITHGQNGLLVAPEDPAALAEGILAVLTDAELARRLRQGGLERADEFSLHDAVEAYHQVAEHVCGWFQ
jgi:glycosyltransferase involved in cell wall biosynthesis